MEPTDVNVINPFVDVLEEPELTVTDVGMMGTNPEPLAIWSIDTDLLWSEFSQRSNLIVDVIMQPLPEA